MSLTYLVVALLNERCGRCGTVDDLMPNLDGYTRRQIIKTMQNACDAGWLKCDGRGPRVKGQGRKTATPGTYRVVCLPAVKERKSKPIERRRELRPVVSSVFDLGKIYGGSSGNVPEVTRSEQRTRSAADPFLFAPDARLAA